MSAGIQIVGDEIRHDGQLVAILTTGVPPTMMDRFTEALDNGEGDGSAVLDKLEKQAGEAARGGLLLLTDLAKIVAQLKEG